MIVRNIDNVVLYDNDWVLTDSGAINESKNKRDSKTTTATATEYNDQVPKPFVGGHYTYENGLFTFTQSGLNDYKNKTKKQINKIRYNRSTTDIPHTSATGSYTYFHSTEAIAEFKQVVNEVTNPLIPINYMQGTGGYWRSNNDINVPLTEAEFLDLSATVTLWAAGIIRESHRVKSLIESATTKAEIDTLVNDYKTFNPLGN